LPEPPNPCSTFITIAVLHWLIVAKVFESADKGIYVEGCTEILILGPNDLFDVLRWGQENRSTASTNMNERSSRSHSIFMLHLQQRDLTDLTVKQGKLYLVDLAGSEKVGRVPG
jgi:kinesin family protein 5